MDVEILDVQIKEGIVTRECNDVSEENLRRLERLRDDAVEEPITFEFDTHISKVQKDLHNWLHSQKATKGSATWGEALRSVIGTVTVIPRRYRQRSW